MHNVINSANFVSLTVCYLLLSIMESSAYGDKNPSSAPSSNASEPGLELIARVNPIEVKSSQPVVIDLYIKNSATHLLWFWETLPEADFEFVIKNSLGEVMPMTRYGDWVKPNKFLETNARRIIIKVKPGEEIRYKIVISRLYDMTMADDYTIEVSRKVPAEDEKQQTIHGPTTRVVIKEGEEKEQHIQK